MQSESFDPYQQWLGLTTKNRPPNFYELLNLKDFESDTETISQAVDHQTSILRMVTGDMAGLAQELLSDIEKARACLLIKESKQDYDLQLQNVTGGASPTTPPATPPADEQSIMRERIQSQKAKEKNDQRLKVVMDRALWISCGICVIAIGWVLTVRISGCNQEPTTLVEEDGIDVPNQISSQKLQPQKKLGSSLISPLEKEAKKKLLESAKENKNVPAEETPHSKVEKKPHATKSDANEPKFQSIKETIGFFDFNDPVNETDRLEGLAPVQISNVKWGKNKKGGYIELDEKSELWVDSKTAFDTIKRLTLLCRFKTNAKSRTQYLFSIKGKLVVMLDKGKLRMGRQGKPTTSNLDQPLADDQWHSLAITFDELCQVWLDGKFVAEYPLGLPKFKGNMGPTEFGKASAVKGSEFVGRIQTIGLYWIVLSEEQIRSQFAK